MKIYKLFCILKKDKVWETIAPTLNLWGIYVIVVTIISRLMGTTVVAIFSVMIGILWYIQKKSTKKAFEQFWKEIPLISHSIFILLEVGVVLWLFNCLMKIVFFVKQLFINKIKIKYEQITL